MNNKEQEVVLTFSVKDLQGKTVEQIDEMISLKRQQKEISDFYNYLMGLKNDTKRSG